MRDYEFKMLMAVLLAGGKMDHKEWGDAFKENVPNGISTSFDKGDLLDWNWGMVDLKGDWLIWLTPKGLQAVKDGYHEPT